MESLIIAGEFAKRWADEVKKRTLPTLPEEFKLLCDRVRSVPREDHQEFARRATYESEEYFEDLDSETFARAELLGVPHNAARYFTDPKPLRPYGLKKRLEETVAAWASELLGKTVSPRRVRECHDCARAAQRDDL